MPRIIYIVVYWIHTWKYIRTLENATLISKPAVPFFWRTSQSTDHGPDYWNHGPIFIPGEERYTITTKNPEIFPPWLTRTVPSEFPFPFINMTTIRRIMHKTSPAVASVIPQKLMVNISNGATTDKAKLTLAKTTTDIISKELQRTKTSNTKGMAIVKLTQTIRHMISPVVPKFTKSSITTTDTAITKLTETLMNTITPGVPTFTKTSRTTDTPIQLTKTIMRNMITPGKPKPKTGTTTTDTPMLTLADTMINMISPKLLKHTKSSRMTTSPVVDDIFEMHSLSDLDYDFDNYNHKAVTRFQDELTDATVISKPNSIKTPVTNREMAITKKHFKYKERTAPTLEGDTEPFSVFLRNILKTLSLKSPYVLSALAEAFIKHVTDLILSGKCTVLGLETNFYLMKILRDMNGVPEVLQKNLNQAYNILMHRPVLMDADINELLNYMDDMYDEEEEEAMQQVLTMVIQFPEIRKTAAEIAQSFVNAIFLNPMQRVSGSWEAKTLFNMITNVLNKRMSIHRRFLENAETYNFFKESQLFDEYVKFKSTRDDRNVFSNVDTNEVQNYRRNLFIGNNKRNAGISEISSYGIITERKKRDESSKRHNTLKPNFLIEDTDEKDDNIEIKVRHTFKNTQKNNTQIDSYEGKMSPQQANVNKEVHLRKSISSISDGLNWFQNLIGELGADKNNLDKNQKLITSANNENRTQGFYSLHHAHNTEKYNFRRHTILSPGGDISTKLIIYDIPKYDDNIYGDDYSKYRNVIKNHVKHEPTKKLYNKSPIYNALRDYHLPTNKTSKPIRPIHTQLKYWTTNGIKYTPSVKPKLNNYKMVPKMKTYTKETYNSKNNYRNNEPVQIANSRNKKVEQAEANKKAHSYAEDKVAHGDLHRNTSLFMNNENKYNTVKSDQHNKLRYTFSNLKLNMKINKQLTTQDKALRNKSLVTNNKFKTYNGLFHQRMKPVSQNIQNNKLSTKTSWSSLHFGGPGNSKQLHQNTVKQTNNNYTPYKTKTTTKKSVKSIAMIRSKNKTVTQDSEVEKYLYDEEDEISVIYDDDSTSESVSSSDRSSGDSDDVIVSKTTKLPATTELRFTKLYPWQDPIFRENSKRKHHHKNKHKKHKHGHKHSHYSRKKYEKLRRKYRKLKRLRGLLLEQRQLYANGGKTPFQKPTKNTPDSNDLVVTETTVTTNKILETPGINKKIERAGPIEYNYGDQEPEEIDDQKQSEIASYHYHDSINLFLDDYGENGIPISRRGGLHRNRTNSKSSRIIDDSDIQRIAGIKNKNITFVRRRPESSKVNKLPIFKAKEGNSEELELEKNLHDALRHMDFNKKYYNMSRRSMVHGHSNEVVPDDSYNTDLEAVLKRNIYKTVKKLLEK